LEPIEKKSTRRAIARTWYTADGISIMTPI